MIYLLEKSIRVFSEGFFDIQKCLWPQKIYFLDCLSRKHRTRKSPVNIYIYGPMGRKLADKEATNGITACYTITPN